MKFVWLITLSVAAVALCVAMDASIVIVKGTTSCPNSTERNAAQAIFARWSRLLRDLGLEASLSDDEEFRAPAVSSGTVVILPYNPKPPESELSELAAFLAGGGRLIVSYCAEPRLARLMGMELGPYLAADRAGRWETCRFGGLAPPHVPERVSQAVRNVRPPIPASGASWLVAVWEDAAGVSQPEAACVASKRGYWFSHVIPEEADWSATLRMMAALLGSLNAAAWPQAALGFINRAGTLGIYSSMDESKRHILENASSRSAASRARSILCEAELLRDGVSRLVERNDFGTAMEIAARMDGLMYDAHAASEDGRTDELRAVWVRLSAAPDSDKWGLTAELLARTGITDVFVYSLSPGAAWCENGQVPKSPAVRLKGDVLRAALETCKP